MPEPMQPEPDYTLEEVAQTLRMSTRWVREQIKAGERGEGPVIEHVRRGHKIRFTAQQLEKFRGAHTHAPAISTQVTTGKKRRSA
jgi:hypothetical protein